MDDGLAGQQGNGSGYCMKYQYKHSPQERKVPTEAGRSKAKIGSSAICAGAIRRISGANTPAHWSGMAPVREGRGLWQRGYWGRYWGQSHIAWSDFRAFWAQALVWQTLAAIVLIVAFVLWLRAGAGSRPGGRLTFFRFAERK